MHIFDDVAVSVAAAKLLKHNLLRVLLGLNPGRWCQWEPRPRTFLSRNTDADWGSHRVECDSIYCFTCFWDMAGNEKTHTHTHTHVRSRFYAGKVCKVVNNPAQVRMQRLNHRKNKHELWGLLWYRSEMYHSNPQSSCLQNRHELWGLLWYRSERWCLSDLYDVSLIYMMSLWSIPKQSPKLAFVLPVGWTMHWQRVEMMFKQCWCKLSDWLVPCAC